MGSVRAPLILFCWRQRVHGIIGLESLKMVELEINTSKTEYMHINENNFPTQLSQRPIFPIEFNVPPPPHTHALSRLLGKPRMGRPRSHPPGLPEPRVRVLPQGRTHGGDVPRRPTTSPYPTCADPPTARPPPT